MEKPVNYIFPQIGANLIHYYYLMPILLKKKPIKINKKRAKAK